MKKLGTFESSETLGQYLIFGGLKTLGIDFGSDMVPTDEMTADKLDEMAADAIHMLDSSCVLVMDDTTVSVGEWLMCGCPRVELWSVRLSDNKNSRLVRIMDEVL